METSLLLCRYLWNLEQSPFVFSLGLIFSFLQKEEVGLDG